MDTNDILTSILQKSQNENSTLSNALHTAREANLKLSYSEFVSAGKTLPSDYYDRTSPGKRFSTTSQEAQSTTAARFTENEPRSVKKMAADARKMRNWLTQVDFGTDSINYVTDARPQGSNYLQSEADLRLSARAVQDSRDMCSSMKVKLGGVNWKLGDYDGSIKDATPVSVMPDPVEGGAAVFSSYRGVLSPAKKLSLVQSTAFSNLSPTSKTVYATEQTSASLQIKQSQNSPTNKNNYESSKTQMTKSKTSGRSQIEFKSPGGDAKLSTTSGDLRFDVENFKDARRSLDGALLKSLKDCQIDFSDKNGDSSEASNGSGVTTSRANDDAFVRAVGREKRDVAGERERNKVMKERLKGNTFQIGHEKEYMY